MKSKSKIESMIDKDLERETLKKRILNAYFYDKLSFFGYRYCKFNSNWRYKPEIDILQNRWGYISDETWEISTWSAFNKALIEQVEEQHSIEKHQDVLNYDWGFGRCTGEIK